uniref:General transcription factor IIA, 1-like n=1 Tax=Echeneis naucrates TaxID=173247 RepID=A0A665WVR9_ECHNA
FLRLNPTSGTNHHCFFPLFIMKELFLEEGLEDCVLDELRRLWESKMMQSKAMEDFRKNNINSSNFVLQLPASYSQTDQDLTSKTVLQETQVPISKNERLWGNNSEMVATFALPAGLSYPVQIPAGVTLQTASGQLYKVNVPVVVTQAPAGQQPISRPAHKVPAPQSANIPPNTLPPHEVEPSPLPATSASQMPQPKTNLLPGQESSYSYSELSDIVQLDGPVDNSDAEEENSVPLEENDFLGIINAEAIKAMQEGDGSSDGNSISSSSSDSERANELDPLNSGDDVIEQDIPDLFDTDNVIVCQYDKIHRSKNRWKFHLKDGVMCYAGRDYVFSKAVGEAEW